MTPKLPCLPHFKEAWEIFEKNFLSILILILIIDVPLGIIASFFGPVAYSNVKSPNLSDIFVATFFVGLSIAFLKNISLSAIVYLTAESQKGHKPSLLSLLSYALTKWWIVSITCFIASFIIIPGLLLGVVPGVIFLIFFAFAVQAVVLEEKYFWSALMYSKNLVKNHWWHIFKCSFLIWPPLMVLIVFLNILIRRLIEVIGSPNYFIPTTLSLIIGYYGWIVFTLFYLSFKKSTHSSPTSDENPTSTTYSSICYNLRWVYLNGVTCAKKNLSAKKIKADS